MKPIIDFSILGEEPPATRLQGAAEATQIILGTELLPGDPLYDNCPWGNEKTNVPTHTPYQERIRQCFADAFRFLESNKHARTDADWERIAGNLSPYTDPLTVELITAAINEIEREYAASQNEK